MSQLLSAEDLDNPAVRRLILLIESAPSVFVQEQARQRLFQILLQRQQYPFPPVTSSDRQGPITLGEQPNKQTVFLPEGALGKHLLAVGQSGAGKTSLFYTLISQLEVPFWSFDRKQDYRHLIQDLDDLLVLPWTELRFNPLVPPPGVLPRRWAQVVSEIFGHATALLSGSKNYLLKSIINLYRVYGLFDEVSPPYPSLHELELVLELAKISYVRKISNYRDTVLNRIESMNLGAGTIFDCSEGYDLEELLERDVVFEFDGLSRDVQNFLMEIILAWVYEYRIAQTDRDTGLNHVFVLDEAKQVFSVYKERQDAAGIPAIDDLTAKLREFGEGLIVGDQEASKLTDSIKANTYTKLLLSTGDRKQFDAMADSMHLSERQQHKAQQLQVGEAVLQTGNNDPVQVKLAEYRLEKGITDTELRKSQAQLWTELSPTPRQRPSGFEEMLGTQNQGASSIDVVDDPSPSVSLSDDAQRLLEDIVEYPFIPLTERYESFSSRHIGYKAKSELVENGAVVERSLRTGSGSRKLFELTEQGRSYAEDKLDCDPEHKGRGGIVHRYWQHKVKEVFEKEGWTAKLELFDADVYVNNGSTEIAVEIAMEDSNRELQHVEDRLETGFDSVWVVHRNTEVRDGLKSRLKEQGLDDRRIVFHEVTELEKLGNIWS